MCAGMFRKVPEFKVQAPPCEGLPKHSQISQLPGWGDGGEEVSLGLSRFP